MGPSGAYSFRRLAAAFCCCRRCFFGGKAASCGSGFGGGEQRGRGRGGIRSDRSRPGLSGASPSCSGSYSCCRYCCGSASPLAGGGAHARFRLLWVSRCLRLSRALFPSSLATPRPRRRDCCAGRGVAHGVGVGFVLNSAGLGASARAHAGGRSLSASPLLSPSSAPGVGGGVGVRGDRPSGPPPVWPAPPLGSGRGRRARLAGLRGRWPTPAAQ